jgi:hypothetical protein
VRPAAGPLGVFLGSRASAQLQFAAGALAMIGFLFQVDLAIRGVEIVAFLLLNALCGRRVRVGTYLVAAAGVVFFNLLLREGRVIVTVLGFPVTMAALTSGVAKATVLTGTIAMSQFSVRGDLRLPGRFGGLIGRTLAYFERIMSERRRVERRDIIGSVDRILSEVYAEGIRTASGAVRAVRTTAAGAVVLAGIAAVSWGPLLAVTILGKAPIWGR